MIEKKHLSINWKILLSSFITLIGIVLGSDQTVHAKLTEYHLEIATKMIDITGTPVEAMTINDSIPGPVLQFKEGDLARIHVHNTMDVDTSIHWHGILVPPGMDGVPMISFPPIAPGATFTYEFPIRQSGTYWYHSHTSMQEQRGLFGSIVIEPSAPRYQVDREYVIMLSDWTDEDPHQVIRTLKRGSERFALEKGSSQSIFGAFRLGLLGDYFKRELMRMPAMDIADIAYDRFLVNGQPAIQLDAQPGETIRLRIIDGSATTYFHLQFAGSPMQIVAADGIDVMPVEFDRFLIGVAETYDVLVKIPEGGSYELRATAHDGSNFATVWIGDGKHHLAPDVPKPNLYHSMGDISLKSIFTLTPAASMGMGNDLVESGSFDKPGMAAMEGMDHSGHAMKMGESKPSMDHTGHEMMAMKPIKQPVKAEAEARNGRPYRTNFRPMAADVSSSKNLAKDDGMDPTRPWPPYEQLRAIDSTAFSANKPVREIRLTLDGDMERYLWFLNNRPLAESDVISIDQGEIVRFIMINRTMMHHPMHLHGHFFRVLNGQGDHAPLKHTVDVAPMSTTVIEFDANEVGDWFFHCHLLYHMKSGMARVIHYNNFEAPADVAALRPLLFRDSWYAWGEAMILTSMSEGVVKAANTRHTLALEWEAGWEGVEENEWESLITWDVYLNRFFTTFAGLDTEGEGGQTDQTRGVFGFTAVLPLNIESRYWLDSDGGGRFMFEKGFPLTPRLALIGEAEYDTNVSRWEGKSSLAYTLSKSVTLVGQWHSDFGWGAGAVIRF